MKEPLAEPPVGSLTLIKLSLHLSQVHIDVHLIKHHPGSRFLLYLPSHLLYSDLVFEKTTSFFILINKRTQQRLFIITYSLMIIQIICL